MGIIIKQGIRGTIYSYIGVGLGFITTGLLFPILFATEEVGLLKLIVAYSALMVQLASLGFNSVTLRMFAFFRDKNRNHNGFFLLGLVVTLIGFVISLAVFFLVKPLIIADSIEKSALFVAYINYIIPLSFFMLIFGFLDTYASVHFNSTLGTLQKEIVQRILILGAILLFMFDILSFKDFFIIYIIAYSFPALLIFIPIIRQNRGLLAPPDGKLLRTHGLTMLSVGFFGILNNFSSVIILNIDSIMVNSMIGLAETGVYSIAFFFGSMISIPARSINKISVVIISESWKNNKIDEIKMIYSKSCLNQLIIGTLLFIGIWINIDSIFSFIPDVYSDGKWVIFWIGVSNMIDMATGVNGSIIGTSKHYRYQTYFMIFLVGVVILSNILLIPVLGIIGAALASAISLTLFNIARYTFLYLAYKMQPFRLRHLYVILFAIVVLAINYFISPFSSPYTDIFIRSSLAFTTFVVPLYLLNVSAEFNERIDYYLAMLKLKK